MFKDHVKCCNCETELLVDLGEDKCPNCGFVGALAWVNPDNPEVDTEE